MTASTLAAFLLVVLQPLCVQALAAESNTRPNIVVIMADDI
jgi:hypothetical protein